MITSILDVSNLNASKPSLNKKADLSFDGIQADAFGKELASFQSEDFQSPENLATVKSPNQVSEENEKILTENLNNFLALSSAVPNFTDNVVKNLDGENAEAISESNLELLLEGPSLDMDTSKMAMQGMVTAPIAAVVAKDANQVSSPSKEVTGGVQPMFKALPQLQNASVQTIDVAEKQTVQTVAENTPAFPVAEKNLSIKDESGLENKKNELNTGKFSLEGFQSVVPKAVAFDLMPLAVDNQATEEEVIPLQKLAAPAEMASIDLLETPSLDLSENFEFKALPAIFVMPQQNPAKNESGHSANSGDSKEFSSEEENRTVEIGSDTSFGPIAEKHKVADLQVKKTEAAVALPTEAQHKNNMDQIVTHARTFLKDGGGEMVMKLTPEGLGTVDLKVAVKNGQVSIEINTQNEHVRKMFEEGAKDLRGALEVQNLRVDTVKVNMAEPALKNMNMNQSNMSDKDFARNFMGQFRDERQGFKGQSLNGVMDKFHSPAKDAGGLRPSGLAMGNSSRLNVIA